VDTRRRYHELAVEEGLSLYDASYLYYAYKGRFILVTDDEKLGMKAEEYVETLKTSVLARNRPQITAL
jgi:predicted nucleic acid-binding protein